MALSIVHLSDFHFKNEASSLQRLKQLIQDIQSQTEKGKSILVFTGDLVHSGDEDLFDNLYERFFFTVADHFSEIYFTPGNHDIQRSMTNSIKSDKLIADTEQCYLLDNKSNLKLQHPYEKNPLENYFILQRAICAFDSSNFYYSQKKAGKISITSFNSTWLSAERKGVDSDKGRLRIDSLILDDAIENLDSDTYNICLIHHPFDWYTKESMPEITRKITGTFNLLLYGHEHTAKAKLQGKKNKCLTLRSPAVKFDGGVNAYSIIDVDLEKLFHQVRYRCFAPEQDGFISSKNLSGDDAYYPAPKDKTFWTSPQRTEKSDFNDDLEKLTAYFDRAKWISSAFQLENILGTKFVIPSITEIKMKEKETFETISMNSEKPLASVISNDSIRTTIVGDKDCGLSTNAFILGQEIIKNIKNIKKIPVYIDLSRARVNKSSFLREAHRTSPIDLSSRRIKKYAQDGLLYLLIDGITLNDIERFNRIIKALDTFFPKCPSIIFASKDISQSIQSQNNQLSLNSLKDRVYRVLELNFEQLQEMVRLWKPDAPNKEILQTSEVLVTSFKDIDKPIYASTVAMFIETLKDMPTFRPMSKIALLDRYVESLLGQSDLADTEIGGFNSVLKINLLSYIAGQMALENKNSLNNLEWKKLISRSEKEKLWRVSKNIKKEFIKKGILLQSPDNITFRGNYLFSFFVAKDMNSNPKIFKKLTDGDNFYKYSKEITYFSELKNTNTLELLDQTMERLVRLEGIIQNAYATAGLDFDEQWEEMLSEQSPNLDDISKKIEEVRDTVPSQYAFDANQSTTLNNIKRSRGVSARHTVRYYEQRWFVAMGIYLDLIRFSVNLGKDDKLRHIHKALETCELFLKGLAAKRSVTATQQFSIIGGVMYRNDLAKSDPEAAIQNYSVYTPDNLAKFFSEKLSNQLMLPAFIAAMDDATEIGSFLIQSLLLELPSAETASLFLSSWKKANIKQLKSASLSHLQRCYLSKSIDPLSEKIYKDTISKLAHTGVNINQRGLEKRRQLITIQKNLIASGIA